MNKQAALLLAAVLPCLAGCATLSTQSADTSGRAIDPASIPQSLKQPCNQVVDLPARELLSAETARLWGRDRASLGECGRRHGALVKAIEAVEGQGRKGPV
ncbi:hypothetical protein [Shinella sp.]|jgi:hypothetical protein|uniref:hypothetical protein n=1 Tax=Shinella sp. TaxID=1870904 RepID=UPI003F6ECA1D